MSDAALSITHAMERAALESVAVDDEGTFPCLLDLLDFSGENKAHTVIRAALEAALAVAPAPVPVSAWSPMESAPKGSGLEVEFVTDPAHIEAPKILLLFARGGISVGYWDWYYAPGGNGYEGGLAWIEPVSGERLDMYHDAPVGWQKLPAGYL